MPARRCCPDSPRRRNSCSSYSSLSRSLSRGPQHSRCVREAPFRPRPSIATGSSSAGRARNPYNHRLRLWIAWARDGTIRSRGLQPEMRASGLHPSRLSRSRLGVSPFHPRIMTASACGRLRAEHHLSTDSRPGRMLLTSLWCGLKTPSVGFSDARLFRAVPQPCPAPLWLTFVATFSLGWAAAMGTGQALRGRVEWGACRWGVGVRLRSRAAQSRAGCRAGCGDRHHRRAARRLGGGARGRHRRQRRRHDRTAGTRNHHAPGCPDPGLSEQPAAQCPARRHPRDRRKRPDRAVRLSAARHRQRQPDRAIPGYSRPRTPSRRRRHPRQLSTNTQGASRGAVRGTDRHPDAVQRLPDRQPHPAGRRPGLRRARNPAHDRADRRCSMPRPPT